MGGRRLRAHLSTRPISSPGNHENILGPGEILRVSNIPISALRKRHTPPPLHADAAGSLDIVHDRYAIRLT
jgi:hypothetical protein